MAPKKQIKKTNFTFIKKLFITIFIIFSLLFAAGILTNDKSKLQDYLNIDKYLNKQTQKDKNAVKKDFVEIYLLKSKKTQGVTYLEYVPVHRSLKKPTQQLQTAIIELLKGPTPEEKKQGYNSEIPSQTQLISIKFKNNAYTINLSDDFQFGGGTDSMKARVYQLIKTASNASEGKDVYLELDGEQTDVIGGEGIIIQQPLNKNL